MKCLLNLKQKLCVHSRVKRKGKSIIQTILPGGFVHRHASITIVLVNIVNEVGLSIQGPGVTNLILLKNKTQQAFLAKPIHVEE